MLRLLFGILVFLLPEYSICFGQESNQASGKLTARILAVGIPGASAVAPVGTFHKADRFMTSRNSPPSPSQGRFWIQSGSL